MIYFNLIALIVLAVGQILFNHKMANFNRAVTNWSQKADSSLSLQNEAIQKLLKPVKTKKNRMGKS